MRPGVRRIPTIQQQKRIIDEYEQGQLALTEALQRLTGQGPDSAYEQPLVNRDRLLSVPIAT